MIDKLVSSGFVDFNDSPWFKQSFPFYSPPEEEKWRSLLHGRALLLRYVRRFLVVVVVVVVVLLLLLFLVGR